MTAGLKLMTGKFKLKRNFLNRFKITHSLSLSIVNLLLFIYPVNAQNTQLPTSPPLAPQTPPSERETLPSLPEILPELEHKYLPSGLQLPFHLSKIIL